MPSNPSTAVSAPRATIVEPTNATARPAPRTALRAVALAAALAGAGAAAAVPVSVTVDGLPPGLSPELTVQRNFCNDGMGWKTNPSQALTERSLTVYDRVTTSTGSIVLRPRVITQYVASFDSPATPANSSDPTEIRCSEVSVNEDQFSFGIRISGATASGRPAVLSGALGTASQAGPVELRQTLQARTAGLTVVNQPQGTMARGMTHRVNALFDTDLGRVRTPMLDLLRPSTQLPGTYVRVARFFERSDGIACVQAGTVTRCLDGGVPAEAGGVLLRGFVQPSPGFPNLVFQFELMHGFAPGPLRLRAAADATDLAFYRVDGSLQVLDLLPWQSRSVDVQVQ